MFSEGKEAFQEIYRIGGGVYITISIIYLGGARYYYLHTEFEIGSV